MENGIVKEKSNNRAIVFTAAFIVIFVCSGSAAFSVFVKPLREATGATAAEVTLTLTIYQFIMALFGIISGKIVDKFGPKKLMYVGGLIFGLGWALTSMASSLPMLYLSYGVLAGAGNGLLYNPAINTALRWYPEKKGTMSGILLGAASLGPLVLAKAGAIVCEQFGTKGLIFIGAAYFVLIYLVGWKMVTPEKGWEPEGFKVQASVSGASVVKDYSPKEMVSSGIFWIMLILFSIACTAGIMMIGSLSAIAQVQLEMTAVAAANMVVINCLSNFGGRLVVGKLCDKLGETKTLGLVFILTIIGLLGLKAATTQVVFIIFLIILGASFGGILVIYPPLTSKTFGMKNSGINYGIMFFGYAIGALIGPQIAARTVDPSLGTSAYSQAYVIAAVVAAVGFLINLFLITKQKIIRNQMLPIFKLNLQGDCD